MKVQLDPPKRDEGVRIAAQDERQACQAGVGGEERAQFVDRSHWKGLLWCDRMLARLLRVIIGQLTDWAPSATTLAKTARLHTVSQQFLVQ